MYIHTTTTIEVMKIKSYDRLNEGKSELKKEEEWKKSWKSENKSFFEWKYAEISFCQSH